MLAPFASFDGFELAAVDGVDADDALDGSVVEGTLSVVLDASPFVWAFGIPVVEPVASPLADSVAVVAIVFFEVEAVSFAARS